MSASVPQVPRPSSTSPPLPTQLPLPDRHASQIMFAVENARASGTEFQTLAATLVLHQAEDGGIFIYDLLQSPVIPVACARLPRGQDTDDPSRSSRLVDVSGGKGGAPAYSVAFNPRQRDLLATGDGRGRVIIWRLSWRLANKRPGEDAGLERLFKGSVGDVSAVLE